MHLHRILVAVAAPLVVGFSCEPEVGMPCDTNPAQVADVIIGAPGTNDLVRDVRLDNCSQALCLSTDGSRPYCTIECTSDVACPVDEGFRCGVVAPFASEPLAVCEGTRAVIEARDEAMGRSGDGPL